MISTVETMGHTQTDIISHGKTFDKKKYYQYHQLNNIKGK